MTTVVVSAIEREPRPWVRPWIGWPLLVIGALLLSTLLQISTAPGRAAAADVMERVIGSRIRGIAEIGSITQLDLLGHVSMRDFRVTSPDGALVLDAEEMHARLAPLESLSSGAIVLEDAAITGGTMRVTRGQHDQIALLDALEVPDDRMMIPVRLRNVALSDVDMILRLPPVPLTLRVARVRGTADLEIGHTVAIEIREMRGVANLPVVDVGLHHMRGALRSDDAKPLDLHTRVDLDVDDPTMRIFYEAPHAIGLSGESGLSVALGEGIDDESHFGTVHRDD